MSATQNRTHSILVFVPVAFIGAFVTAFTFVAVIQLTLPPTDLAYGQGILATLRDPFVCTIATHGALVSGTLATPLLWLCLRRRRLTVALPIVLASVLFVVVLVTPLSPLLGLIGSHLALFASCLSCTQLRDVDHEVPSDGP